MNYIKQNENLELCKKTLEYFLKYSQERLKELEVLEKNNKSPITAGRIHEINNLMIHILMIEQNNIKNSKL